MLLAAAGVIALSGCALAQPTLDRQPVFIFDHHGHNRGDGGIVFSLSLFEDGAVVFEGKNRTRISGETRAAVPPEKVQEWLKALVNEGVLDVRERPTYAPPPDADWSRVTIVANGQRNSYRFHGWNRTAPRIQILQKMLDDIDVLKKWVNEPRSH
jgi:hypothetical protein